MISQSLSSFVLRSHNLGQCVDFVPDVPLQRASRELSTLVPYLLVGTDDSSFTEQVFLAPPLETATSHRWNRPGDIMFAASPGEEQPSPA
ncbi:hypothetical protein MCOR25_006787 [Pyricularia grisea]|nr:hypothetical protein MCOR25_006787 [Pyricularia grisea]